MSVTREVNELRERTTKAEKRFSDLAVAVDDFCQHPLVMSQDDTEECRFCARLFGGHAPECPLVPMIAARHPP